MKTRTIVVPKNKEAQQYLGYDKAKPVQVLEVALDEAEFDMLWEAGFFEIVNTIAGVNIDDYEDESIVDENKLKEILNTDIFYSCVMKNKVSQIRKLFEEAIKRKTGIYFYF